MYGISEDGEHLWAFDAEGDVLHHYRIGLGQREFTSDGMHRGRQPGGRGPGPGGSRGNP